MSVPICHVCGVPILDPFKAFEKRVEYRRIRDQKRERTRKLADICDCMLVELGEKDAPQQEAIF